MRDFQNCKDFSILRRSYLIKKKLDVSALRVSLGQSNFDVVGKIAHHLIENARAYGFPRIEEVAYGLKDAAGALDAKEVTQGIEKLHLVVNAYEKDEEQSY